MSVGDGGAKPVERLFPFARRARVIVSGRAALRANLRAHFSEREIGVLTATVAMINLWNRINVSRH